ncbi:MAG: sugar ABC transporter permease [Actinomycetaceae bacterium]|nr:sugar ABC transporter permease [Actinomycetaceae bacterium]
MSSSLTGAGSGAVLNPTRRKTFSTRTGWRILAFLAPAIIFVSLFTYYPMLSGSRMAFHEWNLFDLTSTPFVGTQNFKTILTDPNFGTIARNTAVWVLASIVPQFLLGFALALALRKHFRFRGLYQALVFYPWAVSGFLIGILFRWMFNSEYGVINDLLMKSGLIDKNLLWLADPKLAMLAVVIANVWYGVTFFAIMILAALQSVPEDMLEAASLDGAGRIRTLFSIMIPTIKSTLVLTLLLRIIWIFNFPDIIFGMTGGGPANQTHILTTWMINFTQQGNYGVASALGLMVVAFLTVFTGLYLMLLNRSNT